MTDSLDEMLAGMVMPLEWVEVGDGLHRGAISTMGWSYFVNTKTSMWIGRSDDWMAADDPISAAEADYRSRIIPALNRGILRDMREALMQAKDMATAILAGYPNPDISHEDFRVQVAHWAEDFLSPKDPSNGK